ncbi:EAL domain-containing protein (putative c-di-GMP-specific phosphodiesterase class I) [Bradyrhizobium sp. LB7.2]
MKLACRPPPVVGATIRCACVAEGVETRAQLDTLRRLGCDFIQGYYFAKPMPADAIDDYLTKERRRLGDAGAKVVA